MSAINYVYGQDKLNTQYFKSLPQNNPYFQPTKPVTSQQQYSYADGGNMRNPYDNGLTYINEGGTHEENPNEGVQIGTDEQGVPNLVEEGEVIYNDYVYSDRLIVPKEIQQKIKIYGKDLTYAEAAKKATKEMEETPNDPISKRGADKILSILEESQEEQKAEIEAEEEAERMKDPAYREQKEQQIAEEDEAMMQEELAAQQQGGAPQDPYAAAQDPMMQQQGMQDPAMQQQMMAQQGGGMPVDPSMMGGGAPGMMPGGMPPQMANGGRLYAGGGNVPIDRRGWRDAGVVNSLYNVAEHSLSKPDYSNVDALFPYVRDIQANQVHYNPAGVYQQYNPSDWRNLYNAQLQAQLAQQNALVNNSNGNAAAANAQVLAGMYAGNTNLGTAYAAWREAEEKRRNDIIAANNALALTNSEKQLQADNINASNNLAAAQARYNAAQHIYDTRRDIADEHYELGKGYQAGLAKDLQRAYQDSYDRNVMNSVVDNGRYYDQWGVMRSKQTEASRVPNITLQYPTLTPLETNVKPQNQHYSHPYKFPYITNQDQISNAPVDNSWMYYNTNR